MTPKNTQNSKDSKNYGFGWKMIKCTGKYTGKYWDLNFEFQ